uniref:hotdog fold thioesterase n=1 Tax=Pseudomonas viridiflava TaxID=33069 RepID=UPI000F01307A
MSVWRTQPNIEQLNAIQKNTIGELLDIRFESFDDESLTASTVVDPRTHQPFGLLHGGASVVLAESIGSMAAYLCIVPSKFYCVGLEVNANHLRGVRS